jgi:hypothetical protein
MTIGPPKARRSRVTTVDDARHICACLLREGAVARADLPSLDHPEVRAEVERRLAAVGLVLATSAYSDHVGIRLSPEVLADSAFDAASNLRLRSDACALLVILWARLVLQKRTVEDTRQVPGQAALLPEDQAASARDFVPAVRMEALVREFHKILGSETNIRRLVGRLRNLKFIGGRGDLIEAGPLLELGIDGERMSTFIRRNVLAQLLEERSAGGTQGEPPTGPEEQVLAVLQRLGGEAAMTDLERETGEKPARLRAILRGLAEAARVRKLGERARTRYAIVEE